MAQSGQNAQLQYAAWRKRCGENTPTEERKRQICALLCAGQLSVDARLLYESSFTRMAYAGDAANR